MSGSILGTESARRPKIDGNKVDIWFSYTNLKSKTSMTKIGNLSIEYVDFYVLCISIQLCKDCRCMSRITPKLIN